MSVKNGGTESDQQSFLPKLNQQQAIYLEKQKPGAGQVKVRKNLTQVKGITDDIMVRLNASEYNINTGATRTDSADLLFNPKPLQFHQKQEKTRGHVRTATAPQDLIHFSQSMMGITATTTTNATEHNTGHILN